MRKPIYVIGTLIVLLVAGYFIANALVHKKVEESLRALPPSVKVTYAGMHTDILRGSLVFDELQVELAPDSLGHARQLSIRRVMLSGLHYLALARSRKNISIGSLALSGLKVSEYKGEKKDLSLEADLELDSLHIADPGQPMDSSNIQIGSIHLRAPFVSYTIPGAYAKLQLSNLELDSKKAFLRVDTIKVIPTVSKLELGGVKGHQVDFVVATAEGLAVEHMDIMALTRHRLIADKISIAHNHIYVFRDRRLPLETGIKPLPMDYLKNLPISIRVKSVKFGNSSFTYEEFPKKGDKTGVLKILRLNGTMQPLINHPIAGDPAYITLSTEGSLMGSGSVTATTKMPLHKGDPYKVEGAFHELDVTKLNESAENLGEIHLESGILNSLTFQFDMNEEKATGKIVGEYHDLIVDKLRGKSMKKDRVKSFFLKKFIIPKDKDHTLPVTKRTGKVDYKHDPDRYFSYYLLHALLVGVKSSFSLGFLLPG